MDLPIPSKTIIQKEKVSSENREILKERESKDKSAIKSILKPATSMAETRYDFKHVIIKLYSCK